MNQPSDDNLNWSLHWDHAGGVPSSPGAVVNGHDDDAISDAAIEVLAGAGYAPSDITSPDEYDPVLTAQTYLELAMRHCPRLVDALTRDMP